MKTGIAFGALAFLQLAFGQDPPQYGTPFAGVPDPRDAAIYQVNLRAFSEKGFAGVTERLDQIQALGVNIVYLMPVTPVGILKTANSPYCVRDYKAVSSEFGSIENLRTLIAEAHKRNMAVILDWVANHTAWDHPWINAHPEWYERDGAGVIQPAKVGGFVWNDVAKLDFNNAAMRLAMIDALRWWIFNVNCDGFRYDYTDGPPIDFWLQANGNLRSIPGHKLILYAEGGRQDNYKAFDYNHGFSFYDALRNIFGSGGPATRVEAENEAQYKQAGESNRLVRYITNHDVNGWDGPPQNLMGGQAGATAAFVLAAYNRGVPLVYNGQEIALNYALKFPFTEQKIKWDPNQAVTDEYVKLLKFRARSEAIRRGAPVSYSNQDVSAFVKKTANEKALVLVNTRNRTVSFTLPADLANTTWYNGFDKSEIKLGTKIDLAPFQYLAATAAPISTRALRPQAIAADGFRVRVANTTLSLDALTPGSRIRVLDARGRMVLRSEAARESESYELRGQRAGLYVLSIERPGKEALLRKFLLP